MYPIKVKFKNQLVGLQYRDDADQSVINEIYKYQEYRCAEEAIITAVDSVVDVGAHGGYFSFYARILNPKVKIYALEPERENIKFFARQMKDGGWKNITLIEAALAEKTGKRELVRATDSHNHRLALPGEKVDGKINIVQVYSFADFCVSYKIDKIFLMKIDIEGGEHELLASLKDDDWKKIEALVIEYHNKRKDDFLRLENIIRQRGYGVQVFPSRFDKSMGIIFARRKK
ncbi:MAG: FkbM family methyltransferase [Patescibacteria group bacterium]|jgi:FkbM family methyltransferase